MGVNLCGQVAAVAKCAVRQYVTGILIPGTPLGYHWTAERPAQSEPRAEGVTENDVFPHSTSKAVI